MKKNIIWWFLIVIVVIGVLVFITINNKNTMPEEKIAKIGDTVSMNYTGTLEDGTPFDSNVDPKFNHVKPFEFTLGAQQVIPGWDKGIVGMKIGEKKFLKIPPEDAYGPTGVPGVIPANATINFEVELLGIKEK